MLDATQARQATRATLQPQPWSTRRHGVPVGLAATALALVVVGEGVEGVAGGPGAAATAARAELVAGWAALATACQGRAEVTAEEVEVTVEATGEELARLVVVTAVAEVAVVRAAARVARMEAALVAVRVGAARPTYLTAMRERGGWWSRRGSQTALTRAC